MDNVVTSGARHDELVVRRDAAGQIVNQLGLVPAKVVEHPRLAKKHLSNQPTDTTELNCDTTGLSLL
jgi:hypothetical protein